MFELFGQFGPIRYVLDERRDDGRADDQREQDEYKKADNNSSQVRQGFTKETKGSAYVVYDDLNDAKAAHDKLNGYQSEGRYLVGESCCYFKRSGD